MTPRYTVRLGTAGPCFEAAAGETILAAALRNGIALPFRCRAGSCGRCVATVLEGRAVHDGAPLAALREGQVCLCMATAESDIALRVDPQGAATHSRQFPATVVGLPERAEAALLVRVPASIWRGLEGDARLALSAPPALAGPLTLLGRDPGNVLRVRCLAAPGAAPALTLGLVLQLRTVP